MTNPTDVEFVDQVTVITEAWLDGANDHIIGASGVLGTTHTATAYRNALAAAPAVGDAGQTFSVAAATAVAHAMQLGQMASTSLGIDNGYFKIPIVENGTPRVLIVQWVTGVSQSIGALANSTQVIFWPTLFISNCLFALSGNLNSIASYITTSITAKNVATVTVGLANPFQNASSVTPIVFGIGY